MVKVILAGATLGLVLSLMIGPVFFILLNTSIKKGFKPAAYFAAGVALSDLFYIIISLFGNSLIGSFDKHDTKIGWIGGLLLIMFGLISIFKKAEISAAAVELPDDSKSLLIDTAKGFMLNMLNPFVLIFWIGVVSALHTGQVVGDNQKIIFFSMVLSTVFLTDLLKAFLAARLKNLVTAKLLLWLNRISGLGLVAYGIKLIYDIT